MSLNINHAKKLKTLIHSGGRVIPVGKRYFHCSKKCPESKELLKNE